MRLVVADVEDFIIREFGKMVDCVQVGLDDILNVSKVPMLFAGREVYFLLLD